MPTIVVRDSALEDLPQFLRIRSHPAVRPHQFRVIHCFDDRWEKWIELNARAGDYWFRCSTIAENEHVIGYISQTLNFANDRPFADCGWNLHPNYWGRGIMKLALRRVLMELFTEQNLSYVIADCFSNNTRCKRLLSKLRFSQMKLPLGERIQLAYEHRCLHWIERYGIDRATWDSSRNDSFSVESG